MNYRPVKKLKAHYCVSLEFVCDTALLASPVQDYGNVVHTLGDLSIPELQLSDLVFLFVNLSGDPSVFNINTYTYNIL